MILLTHSDAFRPGVNFKRMASQMFSRCPGENWLENLLAFHVMVLSFMTIMSWNLGAAK